MEEMKQTISEVMEIRRATIWRNALMDSMEEMRKENPATSVVLLELWLRIHNKLEPKGKK